VIESFSFGIAIIVLADFLVSAAVAAESAASVYSPGFTKEHSEAVISLRVGADETVYALHVLRSFLHFFLSAFLVGLLISINVLVWWSVLISALIGGSLVVLLETMTTALVSRRPYSWLARLQIVSRVAVLLFHPLAVYNHPLKPEDPSDEPGQTPVTAEELQNWAAAANETGGLEPEERRMIQSIFEFGEILCREVMVPRLDVKSLEASTTVGEAISEFINTGHSRIPVYEDDLDNVTGILYAKDLLQHPDHKAPIKSLDGLIREAFFVPETKKVDELLREMQDRGVHIALVVDEYGGLAGLVTLEDILEEIIGEIRDEYDPAEEQPFQRLDEGYFLVQGWMGIDEFNSTFETDLTPDLAETIGGLVMAKLGRIPVGGEELELEDWHVKVEQVSGRRIRKLHLHQKEDKNDTEVD
jgi:putative hemolysin